MRRCSDRGGTTMDIYILRHAEAGPALSDEDRMLTDHGQAQARAAAAGIARLNLEIAALLSSPLPRASQTAQPVSRALGVPIETVEALATGRTPEEALAALTGRVGPTLLVGHEPQLSGILELLTGGRVHMRKAMLARVEVEALEARHGALAWLLSWKHLARIGGK